jgi:hypothetical protein
MAAAVTNFSGGASGAALAGGALGAGEDPDEFAPEEDEGGGKTGAEGYFWVWAWTLIHPETRTITTNNRRLFLRRPFVGLVVSVIAKIYNLNRE